MWIRAAGVTRNDGPVKSATLGVDRGGVDPGGPAVRDRSELPHLERLVSGGGNGVSVVWNHRHGVDLTSVALEGPQCAASLQLPPFALARRARRLRFCRLETPLVVG